MVQIIKFKTKEQHRILWTIYRSTPCEDMKLENKMPNWQTNTIPDTILQVITDCDIHVYSSGVLMGHHSYYIYFIKGQN